MEELDLPCRLIAHGEEPLGDKIYVYNKVKTLNGIFDALDEEEKTFIADSPLGNAKLLDSKCQTLVDPIICLGVETNFADEDLSWTDDEEDARVDNMVSLAKQGFEFFNDMFKGGCIPSELTVAPKKQKRILTTKAVRGKKTQKHTRNKAGVRRNHRSPSAEDVEDTFVEDLLNITYSVNKKLAGKKQVI